jgi:aspartyl-tRNA(Asn)/glutamyl-tRNA(Gln) amidotransferase subunit B
MLDQARAEMGELPQILRQRLSQDYGLSPYDAGVLTRQGRALTAYFEQTAKLCGDAKAAVNWITNQVQATLNEQKIDIAAYSLAPDGLAELIKAVKTSGLNMQRAREVYAHMLEANVGAQAAIKKLGFEPVADSGQLVEIVRRVIAGNPKAVSDFRAGKVKAVDALKGAVMKETKGRANMDVVQKLMMEELQKA